MLTSYTRGSFGYSKTINGERFWTTVFVGYDSDCDRWAVFSDDQRGCVYQISKWYVYRGWAERMIKQIHKEKQQVWL